MDFVHFMHLALDQARQSGEEVPVGAVLIDEHGQVLASAHNQREKNSDPTSHAEIEVIREAASRRQDWRLDGTTLFVTLEPCVMCAGAILEARISRVVFACWEEKFGAAGSFLDILRDRRNSKSIEVIPGMLAEESKHLLTQYFRKLRARP